ncbi:S8 family serine peptidase [Pseudooceanicola sp. CBS1P-1]|nr:MULTISPECIES: S8 family serine peptidase [Pseudooceanicola]MBT9386445.1 S8 family serine peptidase [Pseudooceanicola endophyticus]
MPTGRNPLYAQQWHFSLLGGIEDVWQDYTGAGIRIAVFDEGVEAGQADLAANYDASLEYDFLDGAPDSASNGHGTAVAAIIAAADNGSGGLGVAYGARLTSVDYINDAVWLEASDYFRIFSEAARFDIVNNSWGNLSAFSNYGDIGDAEGQIGQEADAIRSAADTGRRGLGTIFTKAAGNEANDSYLSVMGLHGNGHGDGLNNLHEMIVVAATDTRGNVASYSNWGHNILVAAPAAAVTSDMTGTAGYSSGDTLTTFGGTSAATPVVSGVAALMLEANRQLHWTDVQNILASSARQTGSDFGDGASGYEVSSWFSNGASTWNGGGMTYHVNYGYGMIDARAAVRMAEVWTLMSPGSGKVQASQTVASIPDTPILLEDMGTAELSVTVEAGDILLDHVYVEVDMKHTWIQDVTLVLYAPDGSEVDLLARDGRNSYDADWTFGVTSLRGITQAGTWRLVATDHAERDSGLLRGLSLTFEGHRTSGNDIYTFTDDFLALKSVEGSRGSLSDDNGGSDWINLAALSGNAQMTLRDSAGTLRVDGQSWSTLSGSFENVAGGDGNDTISGNGLANHLLGGRGADIMAGGAGNDSLKGAGDNDSLSGDAGTDQLLGGSGDDTMDGGADADELRGGWGNDVGWGSDGNDLVMGNVGDDRMYGDAGDDSITGDGGMDTLYGGAGNDVLNGGRHSDTVYGGTGQDRLVGEQGFDHLFGGSGDDSLFGGSENDWLHGDLGADLLLGGTGQDRLFGGAGRDVMKGEGGYDRLEGGSGDDLLDGGKQADNLLGGQGQDSLYGRDGLDRLFGGSGDDLLFGEATGDGLFGEAGHDRLYGGTGGDNMFGGSGNDLVDGGSGDDRISGGAGFDTLRGGAGNDLLRGNFNADTFVFENGFGQDTIGDFDVTGGLEKIDLRGVDAITDLEDLFANHLEETLTGVAITDGEGNRILVSGVHVHELTSAHFIL